MLHAERKPNAGYEAAPRSVVILGATGSIGKSTADIIADSNGALRVAAVAGGRDPTGLARVARDLGAEFAALADESGYAELKQALAGTGIKAAAGRAAVIEAALHPAEIVMAAIVGTAGVEPTFAALAAGRSVALANKECLVCAGSAFVRQAAALGTRLLPVDSEHNAVFQALGGADPETVEKIVLTASGGPFRTWTAQAIAKASPEQALQHPNWSMGPKVTIDSAGLMNKGLELIEAHHLFGMEAERLEVLVHPQSIVHGLVAFRDGAVSAGLAAPDMRVPIAHCLFYPQRPKTMARRFDLAEIGQLNFERPDSARFPALRLARDCLKHGHGLPTVLNAANEVAVEAFLGRRISFGDIARLAERCCDVAVREGLSREPQSVEDALAVDHMGRERAHALLAELAASGMLTIH